MVTVQFLIDSHILFLRFDINRWTVGKVDWGVSISQQYFRVGNASQGHGSTSKWKTERRK